MQFSDLLDGYSYPWLTIALFGTLAVVIALLIHAVYLLNPASDDPEIADKTLTMRYSDNLLLLGGLLVLALVARRFPAHFGDLEPFWFAVTAADARRAKRCAPSHRRRQQGSTRVP